MNAHGDVPVDSVEDWKLTVSDPQRKAFANAGFDVRDLTDEQVNRATMRLLTKFGGETPDLTEIGKILDGVRFELRLKDMEDDEPCPRCRGRTWTWTQGTGYIPCTCAGDVTGPHTSRAAEGTVSPGERSNSRGGATSSPSPDNLCSGCEPRYRAHTPTGPSWFHLADCTISPHQKVRTKSQQRVTRETLALAEAHRGEDRRTALYIVPRRSRLPASVVHQACKAAYADGAHPCSRCLPLLHPAICECEPCNLWWAHLDDGDDA